MSLKRVFLSIVSLAMVASVGAAQSPAPSVPFPQINWQIGNVSGLNMKRGQIVDGFLRYQVLVPEGTAGSYSVSVDFCEYTPIKGNVPRETRSCSPASPIPVNELTELEPGKLYEGQFFYSLEPSDLEFKKVNRLSFTLNLRQIDGADPELVLARQELSIIVFAGYKGVAERQPSAALSPRTLQEPHRRRIAA
jgi:hypothetical protein